MALSILPGEARGPLLVAGEGLSFWGGVDPATGVVIDAHHPLAGRCVAGAVLALPTSRGSCTGSAVLLELILNGRAPAALVFSEPEDILTLGALVAAHLFGATLPVLQLSRGAFGALREGDEAALEAERFTAGGFSAALSLATATPLDLTDADRAMLDGREGEAVQAAMRVLCATARLQGARRLTDVLQVHIDGCIYAAPAMLRFAEHFAAMDARVRVPTTTNAISVDRRRWRAQGTAPAFGAPAARLADAYVEMGAQGSFTCAPYLLGSAPQRGDVVGWGESNAVVYANSVIGARTAKLPDFLDLCVAITGRAPLAGPYLDENRAARRIIEVDAPAAVDDSFWPLLGHLAGLRAPDCAPLITGVAHLAPGPDDLKALCAAFGVTSAAPLLHIDGVTSEADRIAPAADIARLSRGDFLSAWRAFNAGPEEIDLVAFGSPHLSLDECRALAALTAGRAAAPGVVAVATLGRETLAAAAAEGLDKRLAAAGVGLQPDLCWCSIREPVLPPDARTVMTNSGKYAHYGPGLSGRAMRFGGLADCVEALTSGAAPATKPAWLAEDGG